MAKPAQAVTSAAKASALDPLDLYAVRATLTEEERLVQDSRSEERRVGKECRP